MGRGVFQEVPMPLLCTNASRGLSAISVFLVRIFVLDFESQESVRTARFFIHVSEKTKLESLRSGKNSVEIPGSGRWSGSAPKSNVFLRVRHTTHHKFVSIRRQLFELSAKLVNLPYPAIVKRSSTDADKPARRVYRSVKAIKHSTIPYVWYSFLLCNSNFAIRGAVFTIFDFKRCRDLEIGVRGHSRSLKVAPFDRLCMVSY